jgi:hypothetical protein
VPDSRLRNLEYDVLLRRAFYTERAPLAAGLHKIADAVIAGLQSFAERDGPAIAAELGQPRQRWCRCWRVIWRRKLSSSAICTPRSIRR